MLDDRVPLSFRWLHDVLARRAGMKPAVNECAFIVNHSLI